MPTLTRRGLLVATAAAITLPGLARASAVIPYTPGVVKKELAAGKTVFLDFFATWCTTCAAQHRVIKALKAANPAYEKDITFIQVDWDTYRNAEITRRMKIPRRSTLVVLKGDRELGRIVAGTGKAQIKGLLDTALAAAQGA